MKKRVLRRVTHLQKPVEEVFNFFSKAENLDNITPPEVQFKIVSTLPIKMKKGAIIDYKIHLNKVPIKWKTIITEWIPQKKFIDKQIKGPYLFWEHQHIFIPKGNHTEMIDILTYQIPGWILEPLINSLFISGKLQKIFDYRQQKCVEIFR